MQKRNFETEFVKIKISNSETNACHLPYLRQAVDCYTNARGRRFRRGGRRHQTHDEDRARGRNGHSARAAAPDQEQVRRGRNWNQGVESAPENDMIYLKPILKKSESYPNTLKGSTM